MPPSVSVCIPTYNSAHCLDRAIESVLAQTYKDFQILVIDNNSSDRTVALARQYAERDNRLEVRPFDLNIGAYGNFSRCITLAEGTYVKILCSDDMLSPECLAKMVAAFEQHPSVSLVGCSQKNVTTTGEVARIVSSYETEGVIPGRVAARDILFKMSNDIGAPTSVMMKKEDLSDGFDRNYFFLADMDRWCRLLLKGDYYFLKEPLATLSLSDKTGTSVHFKTLLFLADFLRFRDRWANFMEEEGFSRQEWHQIIDDRIISYVDYVMLEHKLTAEEVAEAARKLPAVTGLDYTAPLVEALATLVYYGFRKVHELNIDARWAHGQVSNLERELDGMTNTIVWKMAGPLRRLREGFADKDSKQACDNKG